MTTPKSLLSVVVPAFNEEEVLPIFHKRITTVLASLDIDSEIVYVNDGSTDKTMEVLQNIHEHDRRVAIVDLSRNFGKEIAPRAWTMQKVMPCSNRRGFAGSTRIDIGRGSCKTRSMREFISRVET